MRPEEIEITPELKEKIREAIGVSSYNVNFDLVCYYIQFGVDSPRPPKLSRRGQRWLKDLKES